MLFHIQFPIADLRAFSGKPRLGAPGFPAPRINDEFLRAGGAVRKRPSGGLSGWIAEDVYCDVRRAIRLHLDQLNQSALAPLGLKVVFRRFYFDGMAVGKFEFGFSTDKKLTKTQFDALLKVLIELPVSVHAPRADSSIRRFLQKFVPIAIRLHRPPAKQTLINARRALARFYASTSTKHDETVNYQDVVAGAPGIFIVAKHEELKPSSFPKSARQIDLKHEGLALYHWWQNSSGRQLHIWMCVCADAKEEKNSRNLRLYLLRMNAESETLMHVFRAIEEYQIVPKGRDPAGQALQQYLTNATDNILSLSRKTRQFAVNPELLAQVAAATDSVFTEERREALQVRLTNLSFRLNLVRKVVQRAGTQALPGDFDFPPPPTSIVVNIFSGIKINLTIASNWVFNMKLTKQNSSLLSFIFGAVFVATLLVVNIAIPNPTPTQWETFRIILALAAGGVGAMIPGFLNVQIAPSAKIVISAGGALAVFVIVYFFHPGLPPTSHIGS